MTRFLSDGGAQEPKKESAKPKQDKADVPPEVYAHVLAVVEKVQTKSANTGGGVRVWLDIPESEGEEAAKLFEAALKGQVYLVSFMAWKGKRG